MTSFIAIKPFVITTLVMVGTSSCQDSFMKQTTADKTGAISRMAASVDDSGNVVASFDPTKAGTQLLSVASGAVSGAAIAIPPGSLSIPVSITVGEGVALASTTFTKQLGLTGNTINASGPSVSFTASQDVVAGNPFTLSIPFSALALTLAEVDTSNLVVMYRWTKVENGESSFEIGVIPGDKVIKGAGKVSFQTTKFGTFQVGVAETKITKTVLANTDEPPALKSCERYAAAVFPTCTTDGQTGCVTTKEFTSAAVEGAETKLLAEKTLGGVKGTVSLPAANKVLKDTPFGIPASPTLGTASARPDNCGTNAQQDCVATGTYFAATECDADGSNCFLPQFGTPTSQTKKAVDVSSIDPAKMLTTQTIGGIRGTVSGAAPANCFRDGEKNCIATTDFPAADIAGAASKILLRQALGGVTGNVTLPSGDHVLATANTFGPESSRVTPRLVLPSADDVKSGVHFGVNNSSTGSLDPGAGVQSCNSNGQSNCFASGDFLAGKACNVGDSNCFIKSFYPNSQSLKAMNFDELSANASNILSGVNIGGVQGFLVLPDSNKVLADTTFGVGGNSSTGTMTLPSATSVLSGVTFGGPDAASKMIGALLTPADCTSNNMIGCVTTNDFKPADLTNLSAGNIKNGITIAGILGEYPSTNFPLATADGTEDLSNNQDPPGPDAWDIRAGVSINGVPGKLKATCRNRVSTSSTPLYNYDGEIGNIPQTVVTAGGEINIWDTLDDFKFGVSVPDSNFVPAWGVKTDCGGVDTAASNTDDDNVWEDVTLSMGTGNEASTKCQVNRSNCTYLDKITGLWWSKSQPNQMVWSTAWATCAGFNNYNGQTGWRLPTQKELMEAYTHGIRSAASSDWIPGSTSQGGGQTTINSNFWSGSTDSIATSNAWSMNLSSGDTNMSGKDASLSVVCVR